MKKKREEVAGWDVLSPQKEFTCSVVDIESSSATCKRTGNSNTFYRYLYPDWVNIVAVTKDNALIMIKQYRFGTDQMELEIPGGVINRGESPLEGGVRELLEETGYAGHHPRIIGKVCPNPALQSNFCHTLFVESVEKVSSQKQDEMEDIEVLLVPVHDALEMVKRGDIHHGLVLNALMFFCNMKSEY